MKAMRDEVAYGMRKLRNINLPRGRKQRRSLRRKQGKVLTVQGWWQQEKV